VKVRLNIYFLLDSKYPNALVLAIAVPLLDLEQLALRQAKDEMQRLRLSSREAALFCQSSDFPAPSA